MRSELMGLLVQALAFVVGLSASIGLGMFLATRLDGPGGLLVATLVAGSGLLGAAVGSQFLRDHLSDRADAADEIASGPEKDKRKSTL